MTTKELIADFICFEEYSINNVFSWGLGGAAVCGCGTPWAFLLPFFFLSILFRKYVLRCLRSHAKWLLRLLWTSCWYCRLTLCYLFTKHKNFQKKVIENSRRCHNHNRKPQSFIYTKRKRKQTKPNKRKSNKRTKSTKISSLFP